MTKEEFHHYFSKCFPNKGDSNFDNYLKILKRSQTIDPTLTQRQRNTQEKHLIQEEGYEKWKVIPLKFFQMNSLPIELSDDYHRNIRFLTPLDYFYASYYLQDYFNSSGNIELCKFFKDRLYNILKRKANTENIPKEIKDLIYYKIKEKIILSEYEKEVIKEIFQNHYRGRRNKRQRRKTESQEQERGE